MNNNGPVGAKGMNINSESLYVIVDINAKHNKVIDKVFNSFTDGKYELHINNWELCACVISEFDYIKYWNQYYIGYGI